MKVLIVEDERSLALEMESFLIKSHYICDLAFNAKQALENGDSTEYDFILLDLGLPDKDGFYLLKELKKDHTDTVFIILTARGNVDDRIKGLDMGADDYLAKPFSLLELLARMQAINRRKFNISDSRFCIEDFVIDSKTRMIYYKQAEIELSKKEFDLLSYLIFHKNKPLSRLQLSEHLWGDFAFDDYDSNYIDVHIKNIRKKLGAYGPVNWLETVRGIGYKVKI